MQAAQWIPLHRTESCKRMAVHTAARQSRAVHLPVMKRRRRALHRGSRRARCFHQIHGYRQDQRAPAHETELEEMQRIRTERTLTCPKPSRMFWWARIRLAPRVVVCERRHFGKGFHAVLRHLRVDSPYLSLAVPPDPRTPGPSKASDRVNRSGQPTWALMHDADVNGHWKLAVGIAQGLRRSVTGVRALAPERLPEWSARPHDGYSQRRCRLACGRATMR